MKHPISRATRVVLVTTAVLVFLSATAWLYSNVPTLVETTTAALPAATATTHYTLRDRLSVALANDSNAPSLQPLLNALGTGTCASTSDSFLSIDSELQEYVYESIEHIARDYDYRAGAGVIMDVHTGELLTLTSYTDEQSDMHQGAQGLFVPGSIIKPFIAIAALNEDLIDPNNEILSTGAIVLSDQRGNPLYFNDWKAHGYVDMRRALGVSSNVYFYAIGGGHDDQEGLGIEKIVEYLNMFGIGSPTGLCQLSEPHGQVPTPEWKRDVYRGDAWRLGDTYLASIGQHGYEVTPLQMTRAVAALATAGHLVTPTLSLQQHTATSTIIPIPTEHFAIIHEGMEYAVLHGTASGIYLDGTPIAAKTGTAEADTERERIHSWLVGYFPATAPKYAFTILLAAGPWGEETGAVAAAHPIFSWMRTHRPDYTRP